MIKRKEKKINEFKKQKIIRFFTRKSLNELSFVIKGESTFLTPSFSIVIKVPLIV